MATAKIVPLEDDECIAFAYWLRMNNIPAAHIANESRSSSRNALIRGAKLKKMGQSKGVWTMRYLCQSKVLLVPWTAINKSRLR